VLTSDWIVVNVSVKNIYIYLFITHHLQPILLLPTLFPHKVGTVQHVFHHVVIKIRRLFLRPAACLTSILLETGVDANDSK
jgi:hypothetical protein